MILSKPEPVYMNAGQTGILVCSKKEKVYKKNLNKSANL